MSHAKLAVVHPLPQVTLAALALAATFSIGLAAGVNLPRHTGDAGPMIAAGTARPFVGVAFNNMSDAAWAAMYGPMTFRGVADNNMSDAARAAVYGPETFEGVADHNMSDAAWLARYGRETFKGVADNNMSDAAWAAMYGR